MDKVIINQEHVDSVSQYLQSKLGRYGVNIFDVTFDKDHNTITYMINNNSRNLGIFTHALASCSVTVRFYEGPWPLTGSVSIAYAHIDGGTNGCKLNFEILLREDNNVYEVTK